MQPVCAGLQNRARVGFGWGGNGPRGSHRGVLHTCRRFGCTPREHERRYNISEGLKEVQVSIPDQEQSLGSRDILLRPRALNNELYNICETHCSYDPLHYPLFFPTGYEDSWKLKMKLMPRDAISVDEDREIEISMCNTNATVTWTVTTLLLLWPRRFIIVVV